VLRRGLSGVFDVWGWDFGDGESLQRPDVTGEFIVRRFPGPGLYFVKLTVRHANGTVASWGVTIRGSRLPPRTGVRSDPLGRPPRGSRRGRSGRVTRSR